MNIFKKKKEKKLYNTKDLYLARIKDNMSEEIEYIIAQKIEDEKRNKVFFMDINTRFKYTYNDNTVFETVDEYSQITDEDNYIDLDEVYKISSHLIGNNKMRIRK